MSNDGVAIVRGKSYPARVHFHQRYETRYEFATRVLEECRDSIGLRNTLTIEFVWNNDD